MLTSILSQFGMRPELFQVEQLVSGLINHTWKVTGDEQAFILQKINTSVFKSPEIIASNLSQIADYLHTVDPEYPLVAPLQAANGSYLVHDSDGGTYRLLPYVSDSVTIEVVDTEFQAYQAAQQFGRFTAKLSGFDVKKLKPTIPDFHNLLLRFEQFELALKNAVPERLSKAGDAISQAYQYQEINKTYRQIVEEGTIPLRVIHHDTKISNVLFNREGTGNCVIDLDTVMSGYFFSDVGDMMRTYLSPANEEETDLSRIEVREGYFKAIVEGYFSEMGGILTPAEKDLFIYSGKFMIYMQALRFLTDFLNGDSYYPTKHPLHNLMRAENQFLLLEKYVACSTVFFTILAPYLAETRVHS